MNNLKINTRSILKDTGTNCLGLTSSIAIGFVMEIIPHEFITNVNEFIDD